MKGTRCESGISTSRACFCAWRQQQTTVTTSYMTVVGERMRKVEMGDVQTARETKGQAQKGRKDENKICTGNRTFHYLNILSEETILRRYYYTFSGNCRIMLLDWENFFFLVCCIC